ncbi:cation channel sperm-associated protein 3 [Thecamonas trahens ATCC 50062]|uniref:Cation channel sperm-associated protein 3 n=1 Tax=Thecamonas trahens ATCC 50062 TaxID=461836 RepID=A0A0L0D739_THETB|nr:cation channel sperm-associated protein 3 [Thecamonas trahens ATCC 50062]KNC47916.1 cation channel sperm-associated protein 3 [Thecamonas trahens ATCC 50062]|eukprot:XP_013758936.1 cation channel sperm-associated protein 3 [Thecamonas trahens ATCC 50062]
MWRSFSSLNSMAPPAMSGRRLLTAENETANRPEEEEVVERPADPAALAQLQAFMEWVTTSNVFSVGIMLVIIFNAVVIAIETDRTVRENNAKFFAAIDWATITLYSLEFVFKLIARPLGYWESGYNRFDFFILLISYVQLLFASASVLGEFTFLRVIRALRSLRALRSISFVRSLQILVQAFYKTLGDIVYLLGLLFLVIFVYAIIGYYLFGYEEYHDRERWGTLGDGIISLFTFVTVDGWTALQAKLDEISKASRLYTVSFILVGHFIFANLFIGIFVERLDRSAAEDKAAMKRIKLEQYRKKKALILERQQRDYEVLIERTKTLSPEQNVQDMLELMAGSLRHDDLVPMTNLTCNLTWLNTYLATMSYHENTVYRLQQLQYELINVMSELVERRLAAQLPL